VFPWAHLRAHPYRREPCRCRAVVPGQRSHGRA
jgi:hypothetical protein